MQDFENDAFISYAHADEYKGVHKTGWVSAFAEKLDGGVRDSLTPFVKSINENRQKSEPLGFRLYWDKELKGYEQTTESLKERVEQSAFLILIMSPSFLASDWCQKEYHWFREALKRRKAGSDNRQWSVLVIQIEPTERPKWPKELQDIRSYKFFDEGSTTEEARFAWPNADITIDEQFFKELRRVTADICDLVKCFCKTEEKQLGTESENKEYLKDIQRNNAFDEKTCVFLAIVTDGIKKYRQDMKSKLEASGIRVFPEKDYIDPAEMSEVVDRDIRNCHLFVQLVEPLSGWDEAVPEGIVALQAKMAIKRRVRGKFWLAPGSSSEKIPEHESDFLNFWNSQYSVISIEKSIDDFLEEISTYCKQELLDYTEEEILLFINHEKNDVDRAQETESTIEKFKSDFENNKNSGISGIQCYRPYAFDDHRRFLEDWKARAQSCDSIFIIHGETHRNWVEAQLEFLKPIAKKRKENKDFPLQVIIMDFIESLGTKSRTFSVIDCRNGVPERLLRSYMEFLADKKSEFINGRGP